MRRRGLFAKSVHPLRAKGRLRNIRSMPQQTPPRCFVDAVARLLIRPLHSSVKGKACKKRRRQKTRSSCRQSHLLRLCCASLKKNHPDLKERLRAFLLIFQHRRKHLTGEGVSASSMRSQSFCLIEAAQTKRGREKLRSAMGMNADGIEPIVVSAKDAGTTGR